MLLGGGPATVEPVTIALQRGRFTGLSDSSSSSVTNDCEYAFDIGRVKQPELMLRKDEITTAGGKQCKLGESGNYCRDCWEPSFDSDEFYFCVDPTDTIVIDAWEYDSFSDDYLGRVRIDVPKVVAEVGFDSTTSERIDCTAQHMGPWVHDPRSENCLEQSDPCPSGENCNRQHEYWRIEFEVTKGCPYEPNHKLIPDFMKEGELDGKYTWDINSKYQVTRSDWPGTGSRL
jgi:hypothetical protein